MNAKQYWLVKIVIGVALGGLASYAVIAEQYIIALIGLVLATTILLTLRSRVKDVLADERDNLVGGQAAMIAVKVFCWVAVVTSFLAFALREVSPVNETIALTLAYSACVIMIIYSLVYRFYDRLTFLKKRGMYIMIGLILLGVAAIGGLRLIAGEDNWICDHGQWVKHGQPSTPVPTTPCDK